MGKEVGEDAEVKCGKNEKKRVKSGSDEGLKGEVVDRRGGICGCGKSSWETACSGRLIEALCGSGL